MLAKNMPALERQADVLSGSIALSLAIRSKKLKQDCVLPYSNHEFYDRCKKNGPYHSH